MPRTPVSAAALDFFIWGVGHGYVGRRRALMFPWVFWTIGFAVWNIIGALIWLGGGFYNTADIYGISVAISRNYGAAFAFFFIPTLLVGGLLAYDVYKPGNKFTARVGGASQTQQMAAATTQVPAQTHAQGSVFCRSCGAANTPADAFCANCGASMIAVSAPAPALQPQAVATATGMKVCANCGTSNPAGNAFCKRCGNRLS